jgi:hypothetical protein
MLHLLRRIGGGATHRSAGKVTIDGQSSSKVLSDTEMAPQVLDHDYPRWTGYTCAGLFVPIPSRARSVGFYHRVGSTHQTGARPLYCRRVAPSLTMLWRGPCHAGSCNLIQHHYM